MDFAAPTEPQRESILNELNLTQGKVRKTVLELKHWLSEQEHLPNVVDENFITSFAIFEKDEIDDVKKRLDAYFSIRSLFPRIFDSRDPQGDDMKKCSQIVAYGVCDGYTSDNCRLFIIKLLNGDPSEFSFKPLMKRLLLLYDFTLTFDLSAGVYLLADFTGVSIYHFRKIAIAELRELMFCFQNIYPVRIRGLVLVNVKPICKTLFQSIIYPLLKKKIRERTFIYSGQLSDMEKIIPMSILPRDLGGNGPSSSEVNAFWNQQFSMQRTWLMNEGSAKSDESKRRGRCPVSGPGCEIM